MVEPFKNTVMFEYPSSEGGGAIHVVMPGPGEVLVTSIRGKGPVQRVHLFRQQIQAILDFIEREEGPQE